MSKNLRALSARKGLDNNLFAAIGQLAQENGTLSDEDIRSLAERFLMGEASVQGTVGFYDFTRPANKGKKVYVCNGTACMAAGTQEAVRNQLSAKYTKEEIGEMSCLGRCHENYAFHLNGVNYSGQEASLQDTYHVEALGAPLLTALFPDLAICKQVIADIITAGPKAALLHITDSRLRGRGGAGFPIAMKMETCMAAAGQQKYIVCNADEGDPGSYSDRYLLEEQPYSVLLGMLIAGFVVGADTGILYIRAEYPASVARISTAINELQQAGLAGESIAGSSFAFHFKVIRAQGSYVCGEETALLASIEGQRPEVQVRPPFPAISGLFGCPTLVNNVETLANLFFIMHHGGHAFAKIGTETSTGTKLLSLDSGFHQPGIYEVAMGTPLATVIYELAGGFARKTKALQIGGPLGGIVPVDHIPELTVDFTSFRDQGFLLGHASVVSIPDSFSMMAYLEHLLAFTEHESWGKCFPCRLGSVRGKELLQKAQRGEAKIEPALLDDLLFTMEMGSLCGLGSGIPLPVRNAMTWFKDELAPFFAEANLHS